MQLDSEKKSFCSTLIKLHQIGPMRPYCNCVSLSQKPKLLRKFVIGVINGHYQKKNACSAGLRHRRRLRGGVGRLCFRAAETLLCRYRRNPAMTEDNIP
jgi:hypothetical protein